MKLKNGTSIPATVSTSSVVAQVGRLLNHYPNSTFDYRFLYKMIQKFEIRNSTSKFLIFQIEGEENVVQVVYRNESIWCTQKAMVQLLMWV